MVWLGGDATAPLRRDPRCGAPYAHVERGSQRQPTPRFRVAAVRWATPELFACSSARFRQAPIGLNLPRWSVRALVRRRTAGTATIGHAEGSLAADVTVPGAALCALGLAGRGPGRQRRHRVPDHEVGAAPLRRARHEPGVRPDQQPPPQQADARRPAAPDLAVVRLLRPAAPQAPRDLVLLLGREPDLRWRTCAGAILDLAQDLGSDLVVSLGAYLAPTSHAGP